MFSCNHNLKSEDVSRYRRQIIIDDIGVAGQEKLLGTSILIIGAGGLGCPVGLYCAAAGVGRIGIVDGDFVSLDNLHRQIAHAEKRVGELKVDSLKIAINQLNSTTKVEVHALHLISDNAATIFNNYDIVADCTDNVPTRYLISDMCVKFGKPLVSGSALRWDGQLSVYNFGKDCPCYRCVFPCPPPSESVSRCADSGVIGPVVGMIGSLQAIEIIKIAAKNISSFAGHLYVFNGLSGTSRRIRLRNRRSNCLACNPTNNETISFDYQTQCYLAANDETVSLKLLCDEDRLTTREYYNLCGTSSTESICLVDTRPKHEFDIGHLIGAKNIVYPLLVKMSRTDFLKATGRSEQSLNSEGVYVICRRGNHSQLAVQNLRDKFPDIDPFRFKDIVGGYTSWANTVEPSFPIY